MVFRLVIVIVAGLAGAGLITLASAWFADYASSADTKIRRRAQLVEALLGLAMLIFEGVTAQSERERKLAAVAIAAIAVVWSFRALRLLLNRKRA